MQINYFNYLPTDGYSIFSEILWNNKVYTLDYDNQLYLYDLEAKERVSIGKFRVDKIIKVSSNGTYLLLKINEKSKYPVLYDTIKDEIIHIYDPENSITEISMKGINIKGKLTYNKKHNYHFDINETHLLINKEIGDNIHGLIFEIKSGLFNPFDLNLNNEIYKSYRLNPIKVEPFTTKFIYKFYLYTNDYNYLIVYDGIGEYRMMDINYEYFFKRISYNQFLTIIMKKEFEENSDNEENSDSEDQTMTTTILYQFSGKGEIRKIKNIDIIIMNEGFTYTNFFYIKDNNLVFLDTDNLEKSYEFKYINDDKFQIIEHNFTNYNYEHNIFISINGKYLLKDENKSIYESVPLINSPLNCKKLIEMWKKKNAYLISGDKELPINKFLACLYSETIEEYLIENNNPNEIYLSNEIELNEISLDKINQVFIDTFHGITNTYPLVRKYLLLKV